MVTVVDSEANTGWSTRGSDASTDPPSPPSSVAPVHLWMIDDKKTKRQKDKKI